MINIAWKIVNRSFSNKKDKAGMPYVCHLERVSENAKKYFTGKKEEIDILVTAAILHDLVEDCKEWTIEHVRAIFDVHVADIVDRLTKRETTKWDDYIHNINNDKFATAIKLADLEDNSNILRLTTFDDKDIERLKKYHKAYMLLNSGKPMYYE